MRRNKAIYVCMPDDQKYQQGKGKEEDEKEEGKKEKIKKTSAPR